MQSTNTPPLPPSQSHIHTYSKQSAMDNKNHWCACAAGIRQRVALLSASPVAPPPPCISTSPSLTAWGMGQEKSVCHCVWSLCASYPRPCVEASGVCVLMHWESYEWLYIRHSPGHLVRLVGQMRTFKLSTLRGGKNNAAAYWIEFKQRIMRVGTGRAVC